MQAPLLTWSDGELLREGRPHRIFGGALHYFRVHPELWRDRIARLAALGLNTIETTIAWNFHEGRRGHARFDGWRDVERFLQLIDEAGMDAIVRPSPYMCGEWDNAAFPAWLTALPGIRPRSSDPVYLDAVRDWYDELVPRLAPLQACHGGPIVAVQIENEFGSHGDDADYLLALRRMLEERGIRELFFTADGPVDLALDGGTLPDVLATATFGSRATEAAELMRSRRPNDPFFCAELWGGWFDHWGESHHVRSPENAAATVEEVVATGGSVNLYMAHGGTNFGLWAGANHNGTHLQPTETSYDSDAPVAEDGTATEKFHRLREIFARERVVDLPPVPPSLARLAPRVLPVRARGELLPLLRGAADAVGAAHPPTFEQLGLDAGLALYEATPLLPQRDVRLTIKGLRDRALVFVDDRFVAVLDAVAAEEGVVLAGRGRRVKLEVVVENQGRINYGPLIGEGKGILGGVFLDWRHVQRWNARALPLDEWSQDTLDAMITRLENNVDTGDSPIERGLATADLIVDEPADTFLAFPGFGKGFVWINDFLLGRYWEIGPQETYYVPGPLLRRGVNRITVLELERLGTNIEVRAEADLGPNEVYSEEIVMAAAAAAAGLD